MMLSLSAPHGAEGRFFASGKENAMEIDVTGRHFHVSQSLKDYAIEKVKKLDKYSLKIEHAHIIFEVQKFIHIAEITLRGKNMRMTAKEESADMYAAFDNCFGNIQLQMRRKHDKARDHRGPLSKKIAKK
jgi:putative sigma-54 modulation protein